jgi:GNAT superfamily N-acetyltransferase
MTETHFEYRQAGEEDVPVIASMIHRMVTELVLYGGYSVNETQAVWAKVEEQVQENIASSRHRYLLVRCGDPPIDAGMIMARLDELEPVFLSKTSLHISAVYTLPELRGQGIARQLIGKVLEWGQRMNADQADLHVLVENPARKLYTKMGFRERELEMVLPLIVKEDQNGQFESDFTDHG